MADEFITALVKFVADDSQFQETADRVERRAAEAVRARDQAFAESFRRVRGEGGAGGGAPTEGELPSAEAAAGDTFNTSATVLSALSAKAAALGHNSRAAKEATRANQDLGKSAQPVVDGLDMTSKQLRVGAVLLRQFSGSILGSLNPALGSVVSRMASVTRATAGMGVGFAAGAAVAIGFTAILGKMIQEANKAVELTVKLGQAKAYGDTGAALGIIKEAQSGLAAYQENLKRANDTNIGLVERWTGKINTTVSFFTGSKATLEATEKSGLSLAKDLLGRYEIPKAAIASRLEFLAAQRESIEANLKEVTTQEGVAQASQEIIENLREQTEEQANAISLAAEQQEKSLNAAGLYEAALGIASATAVKISALRLKAGLDEKKALDDNRKLAASIAVEQIEATGKIAQIEANRAKAARDGILQVAEAERGLAESRAKFSGTAFAGTDQFQSQRRALTEQGFAEAAAEQERAAAEKTATLRVRIEASTGRERLGLERELAAHLGQIEVDRTKLAADQAVARVELAKKEAEEKEAAAEQRARVRDLAARQQGLIGGLTIDTELGNIRATSQDLDASAETRVASAERFRARTREIDEQYFTLLRTLGQRSLADEVRRQAEIVATAARGTSERLEAEQRLAAGIKQLRDQAAAAGEGLLGKAAGRLRAQGIEEASLGELQQEIAAMRQEAAQNIGGLRAGGTVNLGQIGESFATAKQFGQLGELGVTSGQAVGTALGEASRQLAGLAPAVSGEFSVGAAEGSNLSQSLTRMTESYQRAFIETGQAADKFLADFRAKMDSGNAAIADALFETFMDRVVRRLDDEARRQ